VWVVVLRARGTFGATGANWTIAHDGMDWTWFVVIGATSIFSSRPSATTANVTYEAQRNFVREMAAKIDLRTVELPGQRSPTTRAAVQQAMYIVGGESVLLPSYVH
jgi:hypothetical protein